MNTRNSRWAGVIACAVAISTSSLFAAGVGVGQNGSNASGNTATPHTIAWWCVDLNSLWHVDVPVVIGPLVAIAPNPSPIAHPCTNPFPVTVPNGSTFVPGPTAWYANKTYPPAVRAALQYKGYDFHSQSPLEDFLSKLMEIRVEVRTNPGDLLVATYRFDPQQNFRRIQWRDYGKPDIDPAPGSDLSAEEKGRLPMIGFPVIVGPVPPGTYRSWTYWTLSEEHNDGLGVEENDFLPLGESLINRVPVVVLP